MPGQHSSPRTHSANPKTFAENPKFGQGRAGRAAWPQDRDSPSLLSHPRPQFHNSPCCSQALPIFMTIGALLCPRSLSHQPLCGRNKVWAGITKPSTSRPQTGAAPTALGWPRTELQHWGDFISSNKQILRKHPILALLLFYKNGAAGSSSAVLSPCGSAGTWGTRPNVAG